MERHQVCITRRRRRWHRDSIRAGTRSRIRPGGTIAVFRRPEHDEPLQQRGGGARNRQKQVEIGAADRARRRIGDGEIVLGRGDLEERHLAPDVVERGDEQVERAVQHVELRVLRHGQPDFGDQRADKRDVAAGVVRVLGEPFGEGGAGEGAAAGMGEEGLLGCGGDEIVVSGEEVGG